MAKLCVVGESLCVTFLIFLSFRTTFSLDDSYFYNVDSSHSNKNSEISIVLKRNHYLHKRQIPPVDPLPLLKTSTGRPRFPKEPTSPESNAFPTIPNTTHIVVPQRALIPAAKNNQTGSDDDLISISKFSDSAINFNNTLKEHNITITQTDSHTYYNSSIKADEQTGQNFWVDMTNQTSVKTSELLSKSHRRAATVRLSFDFPFYGHIIRNVTIATGGFLYTGDYVHSWLAATQYIAPLMANFDTSLSEDSYIKYVDNGTAFTVLWENVSLQDKPTGGKFTFQATLHNTGDIVFVYQNVPVIIEDIQDNHHPVKVGLSDAYIIDRTIFFVRRKTIYEYHRVNFRKEDIKNWTVIYLTALPTCPGIKDCTECLTKELPNFKCTWCPSLNKCSNGLDRSRQDWLMKGCDKRQIKNETECSQMTTDLYEDHDLTYHHDNNFDPIEDPTKASSRISHDQSVIDSMQPVKMGVSSFVAILLIMAMATALGIWIMYAYRNPHTTSGQMLIKQSNNIQTISSQYRPSQWSWRRGEARYTAATIHM